MISEDIIIDRDRVDCIVRNLVDLLKVPSYSEFKLRIETKEDGGRTLTIIPLSTPVEIVLTK